MQKYFIPNRDYDIYDIAADTTGAVMLYNYPLKFTQKQATRLRYIDLWRLLKK